MGKRREDNPNEDICAELLELGEFEKNVSRNTFKYNVYRRAASILAAQPTRIRSGKEARKLKGIGERTADKIDEFLKTGKIKKLEKFRNDEKSVAINLLCHVSGVGPAKARELVEQGIRTIKDLRKHNDKLNHHQQIGLKYFEDFQKKIPRSEIEKIEDIMEDEISELDSEYKMTICGSYRRKAEESGDIDTLLTHPSYTSKYSKNHGNLLDKVVKALEDAKLITDTLAHGYTRFMGVCNLGRARNSKVSVYRRLDITLFPHDQYYCGVLHFTGSGLFNQTMREHAKDKGFKLNEYTLRPLGKTGVPGEPLPIHSEKDIFEYIDFPYRKPEDRNM